MDKDSKRTRKRNREEVEVEKEEEEAVPWNPSLKSKVPNGMALSWGCSFLAPFCMACSVLPWDQRWWQDFVEQPSSGLGGGGETLRSLPKMGSTEETGMARCLETNNYTGVVFQVS